MLYPATGTRRSAYHVVFVVRVLRAEFLWRGGLRCQVSRLPFRVCSVVDELSRVPVCFLGFVISAFGGSVVSSIFVVVLIEATCLVISGVVIHSPYPCKAFHDNHKL